MSAAATGNVCFRLPFHCIFSADADPFHRRPCGGVLPFVHSPPIILSLTALAAPAFSEDGKIRIDLPPEPYA